MTDRRKPPASTSKHQPRSTSSTSTYVLLGIAVVVVIALVVGGVLWNRNRDHGGTANEQVLNSNAALIIGAADAKTTIDVFEDFMCPVCKQFEEQSGQAIVSAVDAGRLRVRYHMLNFLNRQSASGSYSSRAAGALQCVGAGENKRSSSSSTPRCSRISRRKVATPISRTLTWRRSRPSRAPTR